MTETKYEVTSDLVARCERGDIVTAARLEKLRANIPTLIAAGHVRPHTSETKPPKEGK